MTPPRVAFLVHGGPGSIEAVRARGLARRLPADRTHFLWREGRRGEVARNWNVELRRFKPSVIYVVNTAMPGVALAAWWRLRHRTPFILDTGDAVFAMAQSSGVGAGWRLPWLWLFERLGQRLAHTVVVRGTRHREHLLAEGLRRVELIRDGCAGQQEVAPEAVAALRRKLGLEGRFVVGVMGSLVWSPRFRRCYGWDLVEALAQLRDLPVTGLVIGDGNGRAWLEAQAKHHGTSGQMAFCGRIPYADVPAHLRLMDIALSTQTNNLPGQVRTTGKLPEYMAAGCFILASRVGEAALLLPEMMLVDYEGEVDTRYPARLATRIRGLMAEPKLLEARHALPTLAKQVCSYEQLSRDCERVICGAATP